MKSIGLVGFGRFGKLLYKQLKDRTEFNIYDPDKITQQKQENIPFCKLEQVCRKSLIILAVPVSAIMEITAKISDLVSPETIVMDVCAVKQYPLKVLQNRLPSDIQIIGTHPLFGPDSVQKTMEGHLMIISPQRISLKNMKLFRDFWEGLGIRLIEMEPEDHDRLIAWTLGLTHFLGRALKQLPLPDAAIATRDYQNLIHLTEKINRDTWELFEDMHRYNPFTVEMRRQLLQSLNSLKDKLDAADFRS
ncbi:MAG: prephenate dehydrogenase [Calditrichaeota bacterium]|nr:prephenate dehydrogenase [Calditrichota bacterium]RQV93097.1 MAG: prephenate dehydrogenase [bacterium]RQW04261.1 MAG: prephenate dehydrogenase [Calditrichota bacterium]